ncbi:BTB/POZ domain-containing protein 9 isoform X4 [Hydra vulgaris]|uniref:BTB/POZ domain-containing protein 9 isoform X4 n=1 Tax=Hydra vulgaris TaxID=6087 RepID=A0ABM4CI88_HYDVU
MDCEKLEEYSNHIQELCTLNSSKGDINHIQLLSSQMDSLLISKKFSDVTFIVDNQKFFCHRLILAARCEYFRALFYGGMRESNSTSDIVICDTSSTSFQMLLNYIYSGLVVLKTLKDHEVIDLLNAANKYDLLALQNAVGSYLESIINIENVTIIYDAACLYSLSSLKQKCLIFIDHNAIDVLASENFVSLSETSLLAIISRDSFYAPEINIFNAIVDWIKNNEPMLDKTSILKYVRLPLISLHDLFHVVRKSKLFNSDAILDAVQMKTELGVSDMPLRGYLDSETNLAQNCFGATVLSGEFCDTLFDGEFACYDLERGFTRHLISDEKQGIVIALSRPSIINMIKLLLWDKDQRSYSYIIEGSLDNQNWIQIVDYSIYMCRSWQKICFPQRVIRYIRVLGTNNSINRYFHLVTFQCFYTSGLTHVKNGIIVPSCNVASVTASAQVIEGVSRNPNALIDGKTEAYDWEYGYTCHHIGSGCIIVQLAQPYLISSFRMLLWDCDDRDYSFYIEVSLDCKNWKMVVDKRNVLCKRWQNMIFEPEVISFIKIVGTKNTVNEPLIMKNIALGYRALQATIQYLKNGFSSPSAVPIILLNKKYATQERTSEKKYIGGKLVEEEKENKMSFPKVLLTLSSTDEAVLQTYANYVTKAAKIVDVKVSKSFSMPAIPETVKAKILSEDNSNQKQVEYAFKNYQRIIEVSDLCADKSDLFIEFVQKGLPSGVKILMELKPWEQLVNPDHIMFREQKQK